MSVRVPIGIGARYGRSSIVEEMYLALQRSTCEKIFEGVHANSHVVEVTMDWREKCCSATFETGVGTAVERVQRASVDHLSTRRHDCGLSSK